MNLFTMAEAANNYSAADSCCVWCSTDRVGLGGHISGGLTGATYRFALGDKFSIALHSSVFAMLLQREVATTTADEATKVIKALLVGMVSVSVAKMPFAQCHSFIAS